MDNNDNDGTFEIAVRLLGNELFAISIKADPLNRKWVQWALIITILAMVGIWVMAPLIFDLSPLLL